MLSRSRRKGSTLVEFAIILFPLAAVIFVAFEMDRMFLTHTSLTNAARAGVRYAAVHGYYGSGGGPTSTTNVQQVVKTFASMGLLDPSTVTVNVSFPDGTNHIGSPVSVTATVPYAPFTTYFPLSVRLGG